MKNEFKGGEYGMKKIKINTTSTATVEYLILELESRGYDVFVKQSGNRWFISAVNEHAVKPGSIVVQPNPHKKPFFSKLLEKIKVF